MKKAEAINWAGSVTRLARVLTEAGHKITPQAICKWDEDVPPLRVYQIREIQERGTDIRST